MLRSVLFLVVATLAGCAHSDASEASTQEPAVLVQLCVPRPEGPPLAPVLLVRLQEPGELELREDGVRERVEVRVSSAGADFSVYVRHERGEQSTVVNGLRLAGHTPTAFGSSGAMIQVDRADGQQGAESILKTPLYAGDGCPKA